MAQSQLEIEAQELLTSLRWDLAQLRLTNLRARGLDARRRIAAARGRVFTLLSGLPNADIIVVGRAVQLALDGKPEVTWVVDPTLQQALGQWAAMPLSDFWKRISEYVEVTNASVTEQIMLLTYLEAILPDEATEVETSIDVVAALAVVLESPSPSAIFSKCGQLTAHGGGVTTTFSVRVAELALTALVDSLESDGG